MSDLFHEKVSFSYSLGRVLAERVSAEMIPKILIKGERCEQGNCYPHAYQHSKL